MATKNFTWNAPLDQVTGTSATPAAGGSLTASTTYYYRVVAITGTTGLDEQLETRRWGQASTEFSATTDATNKTINLSWTAVTGADGYFVFRSTTSGDYSGSKKFCRTSDNSAGQPTVLTNSMTDDGSTNLTTTNCMVVMPSTTPTIAGLDILTYYGGILDIDGGDSSDPITFKNIYDWMVTNVTGYQNYVYFDGYTFAALFSLNFKVGTNTVYFKDTNKVCILTKKTVFVNTQSGSVIQFGEVDTTTGLPKNGVRFVQQGSRVAICAFNDASYLYDCGWYSLLGETYWNPTGSSNISGAQYIDIGNASAINGFITVNNTVSRLFSDVLKKNIKFMINTLEVFVAAQTAIWKVSALRSVSHVFGGVGATYRIDDSVFYGTDAQYQVYMKNNGASGTYSNFVDCQFPNSSNSEKMLNTVNWTGTADNSYVRSLYSMYYKVMDRFGNAISNALLTIKDTNNNPAYDYDGTAITGFTSDSDGRIFRESINITSTGANTITDSSKSWTTNQWKGRMVYITETRELHKVLSNTSTTLTLAENLVFTPTTNTKAGIVLEILRRYHIHTPSGAAGATTTTDYAPFRVTITASGYEKFEETISPNRKIDKSVVLKVRRYPRSQR